MIRYLYQIVFCSERQRRAFRREIGVTAANAMVTAVEALPPGYHIPLGRLREENETVERFTGKLNYWAGYKGCPFCGNRTVFYCDCGFMSCLKTDHRGVHFCPVCASINDAVRSDYALMSSSGFVHGGIALGEERQPTQQVDDGFGPRVAPAAAGDRVDLQKALQDRRRLQLEDKRKKK